jgi:hypothetical protein
MKNTRNRNRLSRAIACGGLSLVMAGGAALPFSAFAADTGTCAKSGKFTEQHQELKALRQKMLTEAKAQDATLEKMAAELNQAPESKKVDLEAAIVTKLVAQNHERVKDWETLQARIQQFRQEHRQIGQTGTAGNASNQLSQNNATPRK